MKVLREELDADTIFVDETITHSRIVQKHLRWNDPDKWFYVQGGLGQGTGVALGVKIARPEQPVAFLVGDGSFLYNPIIQALMASKDLKLPLLIVVFNNRQYLSMKFNHLRFYPEGAAVAKATTSMAWTCPPQPPRSQSSVVRLGSPGLRRSPIRRCCAPRSPRPRPLWPAARPRSST